MPFRDLSGVTQCQFKRGEYLIRAGEKITHVYYLISGNVYRELLSPSGRIRIMNSKATGNLAESIVGIILLFEEIEDRICMYDFIAYENCECYRIPVECCLEYMRQDVKRMEEVVRVSTSEYAKLMVLFQAKDEGGSAGRLCSLLLEWAQQTEKGLLVPKTLNNIKIAKFLSVHTVTVSRILRILKEDGLIERTADGIRLKDRARLQQYADNELPLKYK